MIRHFIFQISTQNANCNLSKVKSASRSYQARWLSSRIIGRRLYHTSLENPACIIILSFNQLICNNFSYYFKIKTQIYHCIFLFVHLKFSRRNWKSGSRPNKFRSFWFIVFNTSWMKKTNSKTMVVYNMSSSWMTHCQINAGIYSVCERWLKILMNNDISICV